MGEGLCARAGQRRRTMICPFSLLSAACEADIEEADEGLGEAAGLQLQDFFQPRTLSESKLELIRLMIDEFNEAVGKLPRIPKGHKTLEEAQAMAA